MLEKLFSPKGRVNRLQNIGYELLMVLIMMILGTIIATIVLSIGYFLGAYDDLLNSGASTITPPAGIELILISIPTILVIYSNIIIKIKRLHDINLSGWCLPVFLLFCLPYVALYFWPGTKGKNRFDEDYISQKENKNKTSLPKAVYNHSKDIASEIKPALNDYKEKHSYSNTSSKETITPISNNLEISEDEIYEKIMIEIEEDKKVKSTWAKALAQSDGDDKKANSLYINLRVEKIKEVHQDQVEIQKNQEKKAKLKAVGGRELNKQEKDFLNKYGVYASSSNVSISNSSITINTSSGKKEYTRG